MPAYSSFIIGNLVLDQDEGDVCNLVRCRHKGYLVTATGFDVPEVKLGRCVLAVTACGAQTCISVSAMSMPAAFGVAIFNFFARVCFLAVFAITLVPDSGLGPNLL